LQGELVKNSEKVFNNHKIFSVGLLKGKLRKATDAEIKKIILSVEQKEDYEKNIPQDLKDKLTVYYVKDVEELEELFWKGEFS
jgi:ATP-dependent Lon protease